MIKRIKLWWKYTDAPSKFAGRVQRWVAWRVPKWLAYWCTIRVGVHAAQGEYSNQIVPDLTVADALQRWE